MRHEALWTQPPPIWPALSVKYVLERATELQKPVILRFMSDDFMEDFMNTLAVEPRKIGEWKVRRETWRGFTPSPEPPKRMRGEAVLQHLRIRRKPLSENGLIRETPLIQSPAPDQPPLKLYQPAHQRHYLVASSLVCRTPGLPDRAVDPARDERAGFVLRRLLPPTIDNTDVSTWDEHAFVSGTRGAVWRKLPAGLEDSLAEGEELLPMFGVNYEEQDRRSRRLFAGVIPAGKRETYLGAPKATGQGAPGVTSRTARKILLRKEVIEPWKSLISRSIQVGGSFVPPFEEGGEPSATERIDRLKVEREHIQIVSWLILLDFARFLSTYLTPVWRAVLDPLRSGELNAAQANVVTALGATVLKDDPSQEPLNPDSLREQIRYRMFPGGARTELYSASAVPENLREALALYGDGVDGINTVLEQLVENVVEPYDRNSATQRTAWPSFLFPLADPDRPNDAPIPPTLLLGALTEDEEKELDLDENATVNDPLERIDKLAVLIVRALEDPAEPAPEPAVPAAAVAPADALRGLFRIRCVLERPGCEPLHGSVVSEPTDPFEIAGFFDPDAPARPIRIGLPIDTTPAGLRKFDKNTAFVISDTLCGQIRRVKGMTFGDLVRSVLPWPFHKDLPGAGGGPCRKGGLELGMICSLSIPIITLCALILLIIMVTLFDIIFRWLPFFILCFPLPKLAAKFKPPGS